MRMRCLFAAFFIAGFCPFQTLAQSLELSVADARPMYDDAMQEWRVFVRLDRESTRAFAEFTYAHVQQPIRVLVDGEVVVTPFIQTPLDGGTLSFGGLESSAATDALAERLRNRRSVLTVAPAN
ncbi:SecDF P1 head subdomain-containing protein [Consotaella aegiceratis]|uniref:SecDF P1 head subdomain-containing protein n=1 Tax=Consotaella aegiceratis TaxID=3097961 RepID=UPI002F42C11F